ncbi:CTP synthase [Bifidobacterium sp. ESL0704]|uniref:CTP synthase n=1 Tax=Bifidobacterium sp. ESL0704 TaxID=2983219 RepID=UPI0023F9C0AA|nr:CTP synthase [Bifidobacterium sp. ESL0704]WEV53747.1 CTP synthase [Bifidobacterium sp. ESL0704]
MHVLRSLSMLHPTWVFAGLSAAAILGLDFSWLLHQEGAVWIATKHSIAITGDPHLHRIYVRNLRVCNRGGLSVTDPSRTLVDCALRYPFRAVLPMFDSAARRGLVTEESLLAVCDSMRIDVSPILKLLKYTDGASENGGESLCRAIMIENGFALPELQCVFVDPTNPQEKYRADFTWKLGGGRVIVLEFDGNEKYVNPEMTKGRNIEQVVDDERKRESVLRRAGVSELIRTNYREISDETRFVLKLAAAGVPRIEAGDCKERVVR